MANKPAIADQNAGDDLTHTEFNAVKNFFEQKVDVVAGKQLSDENYTLAEKNKLAALEDAKFKGYHPTEAALIAAHPTSSAGDYANVSGGEGNPIIIYYWDTSLESWEIELSDSGSETNVSVKTKYESNPNTNAFTDDEKANLAANTSARHSHSNKSVLDSIQEALTTVLKAAYDGAVAWISTNGAGILSHLSSASNPHGVTKSQVGLSNVENVAPMDMPVSTLQLSAISLKVNIADVVETNDSQFGADGSGDLVLISPYVQTSGDVVSFNISNIIGNESAPNTSSAINYDDFTGAIPVNKCWVYSKSTVIPTILEDERTYVYGDAYNIAADSLNLLEFTFVSSTKIVCQIWSFADPRTVPTVDEISSYVWKSSSPQEVTVDFTNALEGDLMLVAIGNIITTVGGTSTHTFTPPSGWDEIVDQNNGINIYVRKRMSGDSNTWGFLNPSNTSPPAIPIIIKDVVYTNGSANDFVIGAAATENTSNPKTIPLIALTRPSLCIGFFISAGNAPTDHTWNAGWTEIAQAVGTYGSPPSRMLSAAAKLGDSEGGSDDAIVTTVGGTGNNTGIIIGF